MLIDSGSGGVNVLVQCVKVCPCCDYFLFCDNLNSPYGNKTKKELLEIVVENLKRIKTFFDFDIVIFACNTLTAMVLEDCKKVFPSVCFIGTFPAVNEAFAKYKKEDVVVLATNGTIGYSKILKDKKIRKIAMHNLAWQIDQNLDDLESVDLECLKGVCAKAVVLGCTHYVAIAKMISSVLGGAEVYSGEKLVAERLKSVLEENTTNYKVQIKTSKNDDFLPKLIDYYNKKSRE